MRLYRGLSSLILILGCGPSVLLPGSDDSSGSSSTTRGDEADSVDPDPSGSPSSSPTTSAGPSTTEMPPLDTGDVTTESSPEGSVFIPDPDPDTGYDNECDFWAQDCPRGEKCMPWADDGGQSWNALRCSPLDPNARAPGQACAVEGSGVSGIDNCDDASMCWDVDPETNTGVCVAFCVGGEANPVCNNGCEQCSIGGDSVFALCFPQCDPLGSDCAEGNACYPYADIFLCYPGGETAPGQPCEYVNVCESGAFCADATRIPGCENNIGCCSIYCDPTGDDPCEAILPGTVCVPWYEEGQDPGRCVGETLTGVCLSPD